MNLATLSNTNALLIYGSIVALVILAAMLVGAIARKNRRRASNDDDYFPPHRFPEIERDPEKIARYLEGQEWAA